jgi:SAM-dependent methyltransferase
MGESRYENGYGSTAAFYDHVAPYRERGDIAFYVDAARRADGPVLEIGCGTGRVLLPTARAGIDIVGLDSSEDMLEVCRQTLRSESDEVRSRVELVRGDMCEFDLSRRFRLITMPFRPFQHLISVDDQIHCLGCVRKHLADDGEFVLDVFNPDLSALLRNNLGEEYCEEAEVTLADGRRLERRYRTISRDLPGQTSEIELIYCITFADGREERHVHAFPMRHLFRFELEHLLVRCGFAIEHVYGGFDKSAFGGKNPAEIIIVSTKERK